MKIEGSLYIADEGKVLRNKNNPEICCKQLVLGRADSIDNYEEIDVAKPLSQKANDKKEEAQEERPRRIAKSRLR